MTIYIMRAVHLIAYDGILRLDPYVSGDSKS